MVLLDGMGDILQQDRFTCPRRRHDKRALSLPDWRDNINDASRLIFPRWVFDFHLHALIRIKRRQIIKVNFIARLFDGREIDGC